MSTWCGKLILHDFIQEEKQQQFNNQVKGQKGNKRIIVRGEGTNSKFQTGYRHRIREQGHKMVTSETEASKYHQIMKLAVCKSDLPEEMVCKPVANESRTPPKSHQTLKNK